MSKAFKIFNKLKKIRIRQNKYITEHNEHTTFDYY